MAAPVARWFVRCRVCLAVSAVQELPGANWQCGICDGGLELMGRVEQDRLIQEHLAAICDDRCTNAIGPHCSCKCGGEHHGSRRLVRVVRDRGPVPTVTPSTGRDQARLNAEEYRRYAAALLAQLDPILASKSRGYLPRAEYDRMRQLQHTNARAAQARDHRARMRLLRAVVGPLPSAANPITELAAAINTAPPVADAPFTLNAPPRSTRQPQQPPLF